MPARSGYPEWQRPDHPVVGTQDLPAGIPQHRRTDRIEVQIHIERYAAPADGHRLHLIPMPIPKIVGRVVDPVDRSVDPFRGHDEVADVEERWGVVPDFPRLPACPQRSRTEQDNSQYYHEPVPLL